MGRRNTSTAEGAESEVAEDETEGLEVPGIVERADGFFGVEGLADDTYYEDRPTAERVARNSALAKRARLQGRD